MLARLEQSSRLPPLPGDVLPCPPPPLRLPACAHVCVRAADGAWGKLAAGLSASLPSELGRAVAKRRAEYWVGRWCAAAALTAAGYDGNPWLPYAERHPPWPEGFLGSITHTRSYAGAAVIPSAAALGIGVDSEHHARASAAEAIAATAVTEDEHRLLERTAALHGLSTHILLTLAFSAKESVFKALYPRLRFTFDFHAVRLDAVDVVGGTFSVTPVGDALQSYVRDTAIAGTHAIEADLVHTAAVWQRQASAGNASR